MKTVRLVDVSSLRALVQLQTETFSDRSAEFAIRIKLEEFIMRGIVNSGVMTMTWILCGAAPNPESFHSPHACIGYSCIPATCTSSVSKTLRIQAYK